MRWCCGGGSSAHSSLTPSSSNSSLQEGDGDEQQQEQQQKALANGGKPRHQRRKKGHRFQLRSFGSSAAKKITGGSTAAGSGERRQPEGILKGTHQRTGRPPGRAVQYADGTISGDDEENGGGSGGVPAEQKPMLVDSPPSCSSPSASSSLSPRPSNSAVRHSSPASVSSAFPFTSQPLAPPPMDRYGPMLLRPCKQALLVLHNGNPRHGRLLFHSQQIVPPPVPSCPFLTSLTNHGWEVQTSYSSHSAVEQMHSRRPVLVLLDEKLAKEELCTTLRSLREGQNEEGGGEGDKRPDEDVLFAWLLDKVPNERRLRRMAKLRLQQFFLRSSTDHCLVDQFCVLSSRLRAVPALFAVVEEAQQPVKICDERHTVQYVNRAYELLTGRSRQHLLGTEAADEQQPTGVGIPRSYHYGKRASLLLNNHVAVSAIGPSASAAVAAAVPWASSSSSFSFTSAPAFTAVPLPMTPPPAITMTSATAPIAQPALARDEQPRVPQEAQPEHAPQLSPVGAHTDEQQRRQLTVDVTASATTVSQQPTDQAQQQQQQPPPPQSPGRDSRRRSSDWHCITVPTSSNSSANGQQYVYVKRGSADAAFFRTDRGIEKGGRSSAGAALVDAPINEALTALANILHRCDEETQTQLREAMRILSSAELYTPNITRFRDNDRIASGYYDGLIRLHHPNQRQRKRSVVEAFRDHQQRRASRDSNVLEGGGLPWKGAGGPAGLQQQQRRRVSTEIMNVLEREQLWDFDVIELERVTDFHPLASLGQKVFERWNVCDSLHCSPEVLHKWLAVIEANYMAGNAYHNATHAADVLQATSYFLNADPVGQLIQDQHGPAALIAATVHDLDHPGRGNAFLMNTRQRLALLYNDHSILENHHVALAFHLTLAQPGVNIFAQMPREEFSQMRKAIIDMVLATDMSRHFEHIAKFQQLMAILPDPVDEDRDANSLVICRMMVKCADIANPTREWKLCHQWAMRIVEEYFDQTKEEIELKLPVTMKGFDRETCNIPLTQCTFADMFARETFNLWCDFADLPHLLTQLEENYERWKAQSTDWEPAKNNVNLLGRPRESR